MFRQQLHHGIIGNGALWEGMILIRKHFLGAKCLSRTSIVQAAVYDIKGIV